MQDVIREARTPQESPHSVLLCIIGDEALVDYFHGQGALFEDCRYIHLVDISWADGLSWYDAAAAAVDAARHVMEVADSITLADICRRHCSDADPTFEFLPSPPDSQTVVVQQIEFTVMAEDEWDIPIEPKGFFEKCDILDGTHTGKLDVQFTPIQQSAARAARQTLPGLRCGTGRTNRANSLRCATF
ncbi:hypothetical protein BU15DRAFT_80248 [Melanogaster broomeanus]|nr:hypothetical protein BU15DRAFT_80248 [Melanogaster broomeanus]